MHAIVIKKSAIKELAQITPPFNKKIAEAIALGILLPPPKLRLLGI